MLLRRRRTEAIASRSAFSLIELLAVIAILGMFAAVATIAVRGSISAARQQLEWQRIQSMDLTLRSQCRRLRHPATLRVNLETGHWERHLSGMPPLRLIETPSLVAVSNRGQIVQAGQVALFYRADGTSDSYAIRIKADPPREWRLICGGFGQWVAGVSDVSVRELQHVR